MEIRDQEVTLDDLYTLNLSKLDEWKCIIPVSQILPARCCTVSTSYASRLFMQCFTSNTQNRIQYVLCACTFYIIASVFDLCIHIHPYPSIYL